MENEIISAMLTMQCVRFRQLLSRKCGIFLDYLTQRDGVELQRTYNGRDSFDNVKTYRVCIHGCIDGYSRQILWLEASLTNSDPGVIAGYFIETLRAKGGCPRFIRADAGTEDSSVQQLLRKILMIKPSKVWATC